MKLNSYRWTWVIETPGENEDDAYKQVADIVDSALREPSFPSNYGTLEKIGEIDV